MAARNRTKMQTPLGTYPPEFWNLAGTPEHSFKSCVLDYPEAKNAFRKLTGAGVAEDLLWLRLWGFATVKAGETLRTRTRKRMMGRANFLRRGVPGFPAYTLRRFPERVRRMADEIKTLNERLRSDEGFRGIAQLVVTYLPQLDLAEFSLLPGRLLVYAAYIDGLNRVEAVLRARRAAMTATRVSTLPLEIAAEIHRLTGKHFWNEVATLLEAACWANEYEATVDPRALKMRYSRSSRRTR